MTSDETTPNLPEIEDNLDIEAYYMDSSHEYYVNNGKDRYIRLNETSLKRKMALQGIPTRSEQGLPSVADNILHEIQMNKSISFAGPLAGYKSGIYEQGEDTILVTKSLVLREAKDEGKFEVFDFIERLLGNQAKYFHMWLKIARESLEQESFRKGQAFILAGPADHGKSLLIKVVAEMLGNRVAKPWQYLTGGTTFNGDLFGSELLVIDDQGSDGSWYGRKKLGDAIKQFAGDNFPRCHPKGKQAVSLNPFWRLIIALNNNIEALQVLPPITDETADKMIIVKTERRGLPDNVSTASASDYTKYWKKLCDSVPSYLHWLTTFDIPQQYIGSRFGIKHYHHNSIVRNLSELTPETQLLEMIDDWFVTYSQDPDEDIADKTAREIVAMLRDCFREEITNLFKNSIYAGRLFARLAVLYPERVQKQLRQKTAVYRIKPPTKQLDIV